MPEGFNNKPREVQEAIASGNREKLRAFGRAGARKRAQMLAEEKAFVEESASAFYEDVFVDTLNELIAEYVRENDIVDMDGNALTDEELPEYIPTDIVEQLTETADKTASAMVEIKRRMTSAK